MVKQYSARWKTLPALLAFLVVWSMYGDGLRAEKTDSTGVENPADTVEERWQVGWGARMQFQSYAHTELKGDNHTGLGAQLRRLRIKISGSWPAYNLGFYLQPSFDRSEAGLELGYLDWEPFEGTTVRAGQFKVPATRQFMISSGKLQMVDRSFADAKHRLLYDVGLMVRQQIKLQEQTVGQLYGTVTTGEGRHRPAASGGYSYTGRLEMLPFGSFDQYRISDLKRIDRWRLSIGGAYNFNQDAVLTGGNIGTYMEGNRSDFSTLYGDLLLKYKGWSLFSQFSRREADPSIHRPDGPGFEDPLEPIVSGQEAAFFAIEEGHSYLVQTGYMVSGKTELTVRAAAFRPSDDVDSWYESEERYSLGLTRFFFSDNLKLQADVTWIDREEVKPLTDELMVRAQIQIEF